MSRRSAIPALLAPLALAAAALVAGCSTTYQLPPAILANVQGTATLYALTGTTLTEPSAYSVCGEPCNAGATPTVVRTDRSSGFDFAFDVRVDTTKHDTAAVLLPRGAVGLYMDGGLQVSSQPFDSITHAPASGYQDSLPVPIQVGTVVLAASRSVTCNFSYTYPIYGKLEVTALDKVARTVTLKLLIDTNCGYFSLRADSLPPTF